MTFRRCVSIAIVGFVLLTLRLDDAAKIQAKAPPVKTPQAKPPQAKPRRARTPKFEKFPADVFFKDAFREALVGPRPATLRGGAKTVAKTRPSKAPQSGSTTDAGDTQRWSSVISADTLEDEVKTLQIAVDQSITSPGKFSSGGYQDARRMFTELATLFAIIGQYEGKVRWQQDAPQARDLFARTAANAKVNSAQAFSDAKLRKADLQDLVRGGKLNVAKQAERDPDWQHVCDRNPLMQRFTQSYDEGLARWTANAAEFKRQRANIQREAELLRTFAIVLTLDGLEDAGDEDYDSYCQQLGAAADAILQAVELDDHPAARKAASDVGKSCTRCHEDYRG